MRFARFTPLNTRFANGFFANVTVTHTAATIEVTAFLTTCDTIGTQVHVTTVTTTRIDIANGNLAIPAHGVTRIIPVFNRDIRRMYIVRLKRLIHDHEKVT